jgi:hypothetical protein
MAKTEFVFVQGKGSWVKTIAPNKYGKWSVQLHPNEASLEIIKKLKEEGIKNELKKDEDGYYMTFSRPVNKEIRGKLTGFQPPRLLDGAKKLPDGTHPPLDERVGNGSDVTLKLEVYKHKTPSGGEAKAARLLSIRVDNLVPYTIARDFDEDDTRAIKGLDEQPAQQPF